MLRPTRTSRGAIAKETTVFKPLHSLFLASAAVLALAAATPAFAQTAEELRRDGAACEQPDGFLRALNPGVQAAVNTINEQRRNFYQTRAAAEGVDAASVGAVFATEIRNQPNYRPC
jgi:uncharacterized protein YdbL (DUF1318 family)